jgi:hypothetical protein
VGAGREPEDRRQRALLRKRRVGRHCSVRRRPVRRLRDAVLRSASSGPRIHLSTRWTHRPRATERRRARATRSAGTAPPSTTTLGSRSHHRHPPTRPLVAVPPAPARERLARAPDLLGDAPIRTASRSVTIPGRRTRATAPGGDRSRSAPATAPRGRRYDTETALVVLDVDERFGSPPVRSGCAEVLRSVPGRLPIRSSARRRPSLVRAGTHLGGAAPAGPPRRRARGVRDRCAPRARRRFPLLARSSSIAGSRA